MGKLEGRIEPKVARILGVPITLTNLSAATQTIINWAANHQASYVCVRDVHGIMLAQNSPRLMEIHEKAGMVTPDGIPVVWSCRLRGHNDVSRACGPDLVPAICDASQDIGLRHYFYGGKPGVADRMAEQLKSRYPKLNVVGTYSPPFRAMSNDEDKEAIARISATNPNIVWVGLSTPKQEFWMYEHVGRIPGAVLVGVGAAFDFLAGDVQRAPTWMQRGGIESLHRLMSEPRRLWRRYLVLAPLFVIKSCLERLRYGQAK